MTRVVRYTGRGSTAREIEIPASSEVVAIERDRRNVWIQTDYATWDAESVPDSEVDIVTSEILRSPDYDLPEGAEVLDLEPNDPDALNYGVVWYRRPKA